MPMLDTPAETVHYSPGDRPLCGRDSWTAQYTDEPELVRGCAECLALVADDLDDADEHGGHCLDCRGWISARGGTAWRQAVRRPCPHCGRADW